MWFPFKHKILTLYILIFLALLPVALSINYQQNDEWVYYLNIENFLGGNFKLLPYIAASFYGAGIPALIFSKLFGIQKIPVLTLLFSISSVYLLTVILYKYFKRSIFESISFSWLFMFNPLFVYLTWGFMTDNYAVFYMLLSLYFFLKNQNENKNINVFILSLFSFFAFLTRQIYIIIPLSYCVYFLFKRSYKKSLVHFAVFTLFILFYILIFPRTSEMFGGDEIKFGNLTYFRYTFSFIFIILIYIVSLMLPIFIAFLKNYISLNRHVILLLFFIPATVAANIYFKPGIVAKDNYYYLINTVQRKGFLADNIHGTKQGFLGSSMAYTFLNTLAMLLTTIIVVTFITRGKSKLFQFQTIFSTFYVFVLITSPIIHDRYIVPLFAMSLLILVPYVKNPLGKLDNILLTIFVTLLALYSYNFSADYIISNNYIWKKSKDLAKTANVDAGEIVSTIAWNLKYPSKQEGFEYKFTYDDPARQDYAKNFILIDSFRVAYPGNLWRDSNIIYLYKKL